MANVERGNVKAPNEMVKGDRRNSCGPMGQGMSPIMPVNQTIKNGDPGNGFIPMTKNAAVIKGSNQDHRFNVDQAKMPQPPAVTEPGKGAIPVNPWTASGKPAKIATAELDSPARGR